MTNKNKPVHNGLLWNNKNKYMIVQDESEEPYIHNGIKMVFRTKIAAKRLLFELDRLYMKGEFSIRNYHGEWNQFKTYVNITK